jgi:hypothetical protein
MRVPNAFEVVAIRSAGISRDEKRSILAEPELERERSVDDADGFTYTLASLSPLAVLSRFLFPDREAAKSRGMNIRAVLEPI